MTEQHWERHDAVPFAMRLTGDPSHILPAVLGLARRAFAERNSRLLQEMIDLLPCGLIVALGEARARLLINRAVREQFCGVFPDLEARLSAPAMLPEPPDAEAPPWHGLHAALQGTRSDETVRCPQTGGERCIRVIYAPLADAGDAPWGAVAQFTEATDTADDAQAREETLCTFAHELQSPLTVLAGYTEQVQWARKAGQPLPLDEYLEVVARQVERLRRLARDVLQQTAYAPCGPAEWRDVALSRLLDMLLRETATAHRRDIERRVAPEVWVRGDALQLEQVARNLLDNACKYSAPATRITVTLAAYDGEAVLTVRDRGDGMPADALPRLFEPFYRTPAARAAQPNRGSGLGLAICRRLVDLHGGRITVDSAPGAGSTFRVYLPLCARPTR